MKTAFLAIAASLACAIGATAKTDYLPQDSAFVVAALSEAPAGESAGSLTLFFARKLIGRPYVAHTLEKPGKERLVVNTRQLDCTTLVETATAMALCAAGGGKSFGEYAKALEALRYRGGTADGYTSRLHYFSDWIADNAARGHVAEIQAPNPPFSAVQVVSVSYMSKHPGAYRALKEAPELVAEIARQEKRLSGKRAMYIPKSQVRDTKLMRATVKDGDIIAIVSNKAGLDIAHVGFAVWHADGLHLLNASRLRGKVVEEPQTLYQYLQKQPGHDGIRIVRVKAEPPAANE